MKQLIVTGDDFGLSLDVNEAIERAHREGILTAASLMVGAPAAQDALERAHRLPRLRVGLHVVTVRGRALLGSHLPNDLGAAGVRYFFSPRARRGLEAEIRAQFAAFAATGLTLDHVNAHNHMHVHPTIFGLLLEIGREYGMKALRIPYEPGLPLRDRVVMGPWVALMKARARGAGLACNDRVYGIADTGAMTRGRVLALLAALPEGTSELYFHPGASEAGREEVAALTSPEVRTMVAACGLRQIDYSDLTRADAS